MKKWYRSPFVLRNLKKFFIFSLRIQWATPKPQDNSMPEGTKSRNSSMLGTTKPDFSRAKKISRACGVLPATVVNRSVSKSIQMNFMFSGRQKHVLTRSHNCLTGLLRVTSGWIEEHFPWRTASGRKKYLNPIRLFTWCGDYLLVEFVL